MAVERKSGIQHDKSRARGDGSAAYIVPDDDATADVVSSLLICFGLVPEC
jgi:hypothetical protein